MQMHGGRTRRVGGGAVALEYLRRSHADVIWDPGDEVGDGSEVLGGNGGCKEGKMEGQVDAGRHD